MLSENKNIFILTGPVQTGKTTRLIDWVKERENLFGIAQPVIEGKRCLIDLHSGERRILEAYEDDENIVSVGKFKFSKSSFEWAKIVLLQAAKQKPEWLVIDEFGKLELNGQGLEPVITYLAHDSELLSVSKLLIVIRDYLIEEAVSTLDINTDRFNIITALPK